MGIFNWKKKRHNNLDDDKRALALETRKRNSELKSIQTDLEKERLELNHQIEMEKLTLKRLEIQDKIAEYQDDYEDTEPNDDAMNPETMLMSILLNKMNVGNPTAGVSSEEPHTTSMNQHSTHVTPQPLHLSDDEIKQVLDTIGKAEKKQLKMLPSAQLKVLAKQHQLFSTWSDETLERGIEMLKE